MLRLQTPANDDGSNNEVERLHSADLEMLSINASLEENAFTLALRSSHTRQVMEFTKDFARELRDWLVHAIRD